MMRIGSHFLASQASCSCTYMLETRSRKASREKSGSCSLSLDRPLSISGWGICTGPEDAPGPPVGLPPPLPPLARRMMTTITTRITRPMRLPLPPEEELEEELKLKSESQSESELLQSEPP